jgi:fermentation-respiration switch protein FrsA (DUF1100 family)
MNGRTTWRLSCRWLLACLLTLFGVALGGCFKWENLIFSSEKEMQFPANLSALAFEEVLFTSAGESTLYGWYLPGQPGKPLILFFHGTGTNLSREIEYLARLHDLGTTVFAFDYRGYGQSSGKPSEQGTYQDAASALDYLRTRGWEPGQIIYCGRSLGAAVALDLAVKNPPAGLVLESPFTSLAGLICYHYQLTCPMLRQVYSGIYDNLGKITALRSPLLIIQGEEDTVVPRQMAEELFRRAREPKAIYWVVGAGHGDLWQVGGEPYWEQWKRFLSKNEIASATLP